MASKTKDSHNSAPTAKAAVEILSNTSEVPIELLRQHITIIIY